MKFLKVDGKKPYQIADPSLAAWGREEMRLAGYPETTSAIDVCERQ